MDKKFWKNKKIFITGHTGFKGSWLCLWLSKLGATVTGYALDPPTDPSLYVLARIDELLQKNHIADMRDFERLRQAMTHAAPDIIIHMAAQPIVRDSYRIPVDTYATNVMGTVHILEAARLWPSVKAIVNVTTDKCYENREWVWGYRENEQLGGYDPYSSSKACSELVTAAYRRSFFSVPKSPAVATARAGNVIGGGDWADDRLIPDCMRALLKGEPVRIRNPKAIRPWQHVLEPLSGYMLLAQKLYKEGNAFADAWNFGPHDDDAQTVERIVRRLCRLWGNNAGHTIDSGVHPHEAHYLKLDCSKAHAELGWQPRWNLEKALDSIVAWTRQYQRGEDMRNACIEQIAHYEKKRSAR